MDWHISTITEANRAAWNQIAPTRTGHPISTFRDGGTCLEDVERELAGDVTGKRVLQLACSYGDEVLSWANLGAAATGIDISDVAIATAKQRATQAGINADFRQADIFHLPPDLTDLDMLYLSWGVLCWIPDLTTFADILATRLRPGGTVLLCEHHPAWEILAVRADNHLAVAGDYFGRAEPATDQDPAKRPTGARTNTTAPTFSTFVWPVSDVVMALINTGLRLDAFFEAPQPDIYAGLGTAASRLPAYYVIKATKPA